MEIIYFLSEQEQTKKSPQPCEPDADEGNAYPGANSFSFCYLF